MGIYAQISSVTSNSMVLSIKGLQYSKGSSGASKYGSFILRLHKWVNNSWSYDSGWTYYNYSNEFYNNEVSITVSGKTPGTYYRLSVWVNFDSNWVPDDPGYGYGERNYATTSSVSTPNPPTSSGAGDPWNNTAIHVPINQFVSSTQNTITIKSMSNPNIAAQYNPAVFTTYYEYNGSWPTTSTIGNAAQSSWRNGENITFPNLKPDTWYSFVVYQTFSNSPSGQYYASGWAYWVGINVKTASSPGGTSDMNIDSITTTSFRAKIDSLTNYASAYDQFEFTLEKWNGSSYSYVDTQYKYGWQYGSTYTADYTWTALLPDTYYRVTGRAKYNGTWYNLAYPYESCTTLSVPSPVVSFDSSTATTIKFSRYSNAGAVTTQIWNGSNYVDITYSGYSYDTYGNYIAIYGLEPSTTYYFRVTGSGKQTDVNYSTANSSSIAIPNAPLAYDLYSSQPRFDASLWVYTNTPTKTTNPNSVYNVFTYRYKKVGGSYNYQWGYSNVKLGSLEYGTSYLIGVSVQIATKNGNTFTGSYSNDNTFTTAPKTPQITSTAGQNSINVSISGMSGNWDTISIWHRQTGTSTWSEKSVSNGTTSYNITGLTSGASYEIKASSYYTINSVKLESRDAQGNVGYSNILTVSLNIKPELWAWVSPLTAIYTPASGELAVITANEWNSFTALINEYRTWKGFATYKYTQATYRGEFKWYIFNEARNQINDMNPAKAVPEIKSTGKTLTKYDLTQLRDALNSIV